MRLEEQTDEERNKMRKKNREERAKQGREAEERAFWREQRNWNPDVLEIHWVPQNLYYILFLNNFPFSIPLFFQFSPTIALLFLLKK